MELRCGTLIDMAKSSANDGALRLRLPLAEIEEIDRAAATETEGNRSQMARRLIREALDARRARQQHEATA